MEPTAPEHPFIPPPAEKGAAAEPLSVAPERMPPMPDLSRALAEQAAGADPQTAREISELQNMLRQASPEPSEPDASSPFAGGRKDSTPALKGKGGLKGMLSSVFHYLTFGVFRRK